MEAYKPPKSEVLQAEDSFKPHILWKIFFWFHCLIAISIPFMIISSSEVHFLDYVDSMIFFPIMLFSLFCYVYSKKVVSTQTHKLAFYCYILWAIFYDVIAPYVLGISAYGLEPVIDLSVLLIPAFLIPTFVVLYRLTLPTINEIEFA